MASLISWVRPLNSVSFAVDGQSAQPTWVKRAAHFASLAAGQVVTLSYPLEERQANYEIADKHYTGWWRGRALLDLQPLGEAYPIYQRRHVSSQ